MSFKRQINIKQIAQFLIAGLSAAAVEYVSFLLILAAFNEDLLFIANVISFTFGLFVSFFLNKTWVFASQKKTSPQLVRYAALAAVNVVISSFVVLLLTQQINVDPYVAKFVAMGLIATWNYFIFSKYLFKD